MVVKGESKQKTNCILQCFFFSAAPMNFTFRDQWSSKRAAQRLNTFLALAILPFMRIRDIKMSD